MNGFSCRNCTEVDYAKRNIDPAHPQAGPFGINDPQKVKAGDNLLARQKAARAAERSHPSAYAATGTMAGSSALGTIVDRHA